MILISPENNQRCLMEWWPIDCSLMYQAAHDTGFPSLWLAASEDSFCCDVHILLEPLSSDHCPMNVLASHIISHWKVSQPRNLQSLQFPFCACIWNFFVALEMSCRTARRCCHRKRALHFLWETNWWMLCRAWTSCCSDFNHEEEQSWIDFYGLFKGFPTFLHIIEKRMKKRSRHDW